MKLRYAALAAIVSSSSAWVPQQQIPFTSYASIVSSSTTTATTTSRSFSSVALKSTVAPEEVESSASAAPEAQELAHGTVVSRFNGGLVAVKLSDEIFTAGEDTPAVVDTTKSLPKPQGSNSLGGDMMGREVVFQNGHTGVVVNHRAPIVFVYTDVDDVKNFDGEVKVFDTLASVQFQENIQVADCFGRNANKNADTTDDSVIMKRPIFAPIPQVKDIALINTPLLTGVTMFDALAPIGKGQNMLMIGHDIQDMRQYVLDMLAIQKDNSTKCIYAATSDKDKIIQMLDEAGLTDDVVLVSHNSDKADEMSEQSKAAESTMVAATACACAEAFALEKGLDTLVIIDNIDQHKKLWDTTTRVLVDVFGVDAVVKGDRDGGASSEMRAFFSSLVQRSAQYKVKRGGGSVTLLLLTTIPKLHATSDDEETVFSPDEFENSPVKVKERIELLVSRKVPLTAANLRKIQIPIPSDSEGARRLALQHIDDLISMSDGQIWLDEDLERKGRRPAMDFQRSVTRIGIGADTESRADAPALRRIVEGLRMELSQANDVDLGVEVGSVASKKQKNNALSLLLAMHQPSASGPRMLSESCVALLAASKGYLNDSVAKEVVPGSVEAESLMTELFAHVKLEAPDAMQTIDSTNDLTDETRTTLEEAIKSYFS